MKSILLVGAGHFGMNIAMELHNLEHEVMAIDMDEEKIREVLPYVEDAQIGDSTNRDFLETLGVSNFDICIVAIGEDFQSSLETTWLLKDLGAKRVISRASRRLQEKFLLNNGADEVIYPERQLASWVVMKCTNDNILDYMEVDEENGIVEIEIPDSWKGKSIGKLDIRKNYDITILGIKEEGHFSFRIRPDMVLEGGKTLLVFGEKEAIKDAVEKR